VLSGAASVEQLTSNLMALTIAAPSFPDLGEPADEYWAERSARPWT
jgi:hypothetical protein